MLPLALCGAVLAADPYPVPPPRPVTGSITLGCYYFPGFFHPLRWKPMRDYGEPIPLLGFYRDGEPVVSDWHIRWAVEHGISFFVFDWYYDHVEGVVSAHNAALDHGFLRARYRSLMRFSLMWCNEENRPPDYTEEQMVRLAQVVLDRYLSQDNFLTVDGRPVLWISRPLRLLERFGVDGLKRVFAAMNEVLAAGGRPPFYLVGNAGERLDELAAAGFAAVSAYNYPTAGMGPGERSAPYATMVEGIRAIWSDVKARSPLPYIVPVSPGWDSRPWYGEDALVRTDPSPELFGRMCRDAIEAVDPRVNMVIAECWNEFGEGSYLEPTQRYGFTTLDALRAAFCPEAGEHLDLTPTGLGVAVPVFDEIPSLGPDEIAAQGGNLLYNPGAEREWGWQHYDGLAVARSEIAPHGGRWCLNVPAGRPGLKSLWLVEGEPGRTYRVSAWVRCAPGATVTLKLAVYGPGGWTGRYVDIATTDATVWTEVAGEYTPPADAPTLSVEFTTAGGDVAIDDVAVMAVH